MVRFSNTFEPAKFPNEGGGVKVKPGLYTLRLEGSEKRTSKAGSEMLVLDWRVTEGPSPTGASVTQFLNLWHHSEEVKRIAARQFADVCRALEVEEVNDTAELHNLSGTVEISYKEGSDYPEFKYWRPVNPDEDLPF